MPSAGRARPPPAVLVVDPTDRGRAGPGRRGRCATASSARLSSCDVGRSAASVGPVEPLDHRRHPVGLLGLGHPGRQQHDRAPGLAVGADGAAPAGAAAHLDVGRGAGNGRRAVDHGRERTGDRPQGPADLSTPRKSATSFPPQAGDSVPAGHRPGAAGFPRVSPGRRTGRPQGRATSSPGGPHLRPQARPSSPLTPAPRAPSVTAHRGPRENSPWASARGRRTGTACDSGASSMTCGSPRGACARSSEPGHGRRREPSVAVRVPRCGPRVT